MPTYGSLAVYVSARDSRTIVAVIPSELARLSGRYPERLLEAIAVAAKSRPADSRSFEFRLPTADGSTRREVGRVALDFYPGCEVTSADIVAGLGFDIRSPGYLITEEADYPLRRNQWLPADETAIGPEGTITEIDAAAWLVRR